MSETSCKRAGGLGWHGMIDLLFGAGASARRWVCGGGRLLGARRGQILRSPPARTLLATLTASPPFAHPCPCRRARPSQTVPNFTLRASVEFALVQLVDRGCAFMEVELAGLVVDVRGSENQSGAVHVDLQHLAAFNNVPEAHPRDWVLLQRDTDALAAVRAGRASFGVWDARGGQPVVLHAAAELGVPVGGIKVVSRVLVCLFPLEVRSRDGVAWLRRGGCAGRPLA